MKKRYLKILALALIVSFKISAQKINMIVFDFDGIGSPALEKDGVTLANQLKASLRVATDGVRLNIADRKETTKIFYDHERATKLTGLYDKATAVKIGKIAEANYALIGTISKSEMFDGCSIIATLIEISTGDVKLSVNKVLLHPSDYYRIVEEITEELVESLGLRYVTAERKKKAHINTIESIVERYRVKYDEKNCNGHGIHHEGYYNGNIYYSNYPDFPRHAVEALTISLVNPLTPTISLLRDEMYSDNENKIAGDCAVGKYLYVTSKIYVLVNEDGIYWKLKYGTPVCDFKFYEKRENTQNSGGLTWKQLSSAIIEISDVVLQEEVKDKGFFSDVYPQAEVKEPMLKINGEIIATESDLGLSCFDIYEFKNFLNQLKVIFPQ
jgi:hypothetical protein